MVFRCIVLSVGEIGKSMSCYIGLLFSLYCSGQRFVRFNLHGLLKCDAIFFSHRGYCILRFFPVDPTVWTQEGKSVLWQVQQMVLLGATNLRLKRKRSYLWFLFSFFTKKVIQYLISLMPKKRVSYWCQFHYFTRLRGTLAYKFHSFSCSD